MNITNYGIREKYDQYAKFGDRLAEMDKMINWEGFRSSIERSSIPIIDTSSRLSDSLPMYLIS